MILRLITVFFIFFATNIANSKPLPPGTGNSVPANILFLVDKSQSMWDPASGDTRKYVRPFIDVEPRGDGNYFTISVDDSGFGYWNPKSDTLATNSNVFAGSINRGSRTYGYKDANLDRPINIQYRSNFIYMTQDKTVEKASGYTLMSVDIRKKDEGKGAFKSCNKGKKCPSITKSITRFYTKKVAGNTQGLTEPGKKSKKRYWRQHSNLF